MEAKGKGNDEECVKRCGCRSWWSVFLPSCCNTSLGAKCTGYRARATFCLGAPLCSEFKSWSVGSRVDLFSINQKKGANDMISSIG